MDKKNVYFFRIGYIPSPSSGKPHTPRHCLDKEFNLKPPKLRLYQLTKNPAADIAPHISSALRDLGVIFEIYIYLVVPNLRMQTLQILYTNDEGHKTNRKINRII